LNADFAFALIVHSHLIWDFVRQCPQRFLLRFSQKRRMLFCESSRLHNAEGTLSCTLRGPFENCVRVRRRAQNAAVQKPFQR
jgi:hypothetical protein